MKRWRLAVCAALFAAFAAPAWAYPDRPITLVIPFPQGGSTGFTAKVLAEHLSKAVGQPVKVEERTGNFGINATREIIGKTDGYTVLVGSIITNSMTPVLHKDKLGFDYDAEITPVSKLAAFPSVFMTRPDSKATSVNDALAEIKKQSRRLVFGTDFPGTYVEIDFITLGRAAGLDVSLRTSNGAVAILNNLVEGKIDMAMLNVATSTANKGKFKPLAVTSERRLRNFPDTPTMKEAGYPSVGTSNWQGLFVARGTPPEIVQALHKAVVQALSSSEAKEAFDKIDATAVTSASPEQFAGEIKAERARWEKMAPEILALPNEQ